MYTMYTITQFIISSSNEIIVIIYIYIYIYTVNKPELVQPLLKTEATMGL